MNVHDLVGQFATSQVQIPVLMGASVQILLPNPDRIAFGIASKDVNAVVQFGLTFSAPKSGGIVRTGYYWEWFNWTRHSTMVSAGWTATNFGAGDTSVIVFETIQTENR